MKLKINPLFPTLVGTGNLPNFKSLNTKMAKDIETLAKTDKMGQKWSQENYRGGYTSYSSIYDLHLRYPSFSQFEDELQPFAKDFAKSQGWNLHDFELRMTHLWVNIMPEHTYHTLHFHPHSDISGAYYLQTPPFSVPLKIEDPRMNFYMNAPTRENPTQASKDLYYNLQAKPGDFVMFESWLRHEVPPNQSKRPRISLSFNYSLENAD
ncbi:MAG: hypothetical protein FJ112_00525 [Deltaproteobacteria bacterium]|nr:hypothetical protein [Deltaproteobacteria bacterium]